jgi:hypothetical protein
MGNNSYTHWQECKLVVTMEISMEVPQKTKNSTSV